MPAEAARGNAGRPEAEDALEVAGDPGEVAGGGSTGVKAPHGEATAWQDRAWGDTWPDTRLFRGAACTLTRGKVTFSPLDCEQRPNAYVIRCFLKTGVSPRALSRGPNWRNL